MDGSLTLTLTATTNSFFLKIKQNQQGKTLIKYFFKIK